MDLLKQTKRNIYGVLTNYYNKMLPILDSDRVVLHLLSAIVLFNPDKDNIIHREAIKVQQNIYMHLLKRYLSIKYCNECESKTRFLRLMNTLQDISLLGKIQRENTTETFAEIPTPYVFPLIREIIM
ncbi:unnamed protein product [Medioppia subpectinata]|uniref:NR LBD domain-containing protein n=1 Tax=Medioppia subpectinata TaxID=1979941 RepID=A0A7R9M0K6_9ACAR|nr:unnamed protein product [Medioppia subpectinata]CAG2123108.1 unnamed protein product [Medioppia subpectinata]